MRPPPNHAHLTAVGVSVSISGLSCRLRVSLGRYGSVTSSNALLTLILPPKLELQVLAGYPLLNFYGILGSNFVMQYNTNLAGINWINLISINNLPASPYQFLDPTTASQPARFYRAFMR